jgi:hypothetical protein
VSGIGSVVGAVAGVAGSALQRYGLYAALGAVVLAGAAAGVLAVRLAHAQTALADERTAHQATVTAHALELARQSDAARLATDAQREIERLRRVARDRSIDATNEQLARTQRAAGDLRGVSERLRDQVDALGAAADAGAACAGRSAAGERPPGPAAGMVLAELYRGAQAEADQLAAAFDDARARGLGCERIYDSVMDSAATDNASSASAAEVAP